MAETSLRSYTINSIKFPNCVAAGNQAVSESRFNSNPVQDDSSLNACFSISVVLVAYNQENFIREAIRSIFSQTEQFLEVILSDDCSTDGTFDIMKSEALAYQGQYRIILNRNPQNMGLANHLNRVIALSSGQFIVIQAGDDVSVPTRVEKLVTRWRDHSPRVDLVVSHFEEIDVSSKSTGFIETNVAFVPDLNQHPLRWHCGATGACAAYSRTLLEKYGPLGERVYAEDWVYSFWSWLESGIAVIEEPLLQHRTHASSIYVIGKTVKQVADRQARKRIRTRFAQSRLAIAEQWLRAAEIRGVPRGSRLFIGAQQLVKCREIECRAYSSTRLEAISLSLKLWRASGSLLWAAKLFFRHGFQIH